MDDLLNVSIDNLDIMFYNEITTDATFLLNGYIRSAIMTSKTISISYPIDPPPIKIHINSGGGSVLDAFSTADIIKRSDVHITTIVEGICASSATLISLAGYRRLMYKNSYMLIHQLSGAAWGRLSQIKDETVNLTKVMDAIIDYYLDNTKIERKRLNKLLNKDLYLGADECLKYGFIDEII